MSRDEWLRKITVFHEMSPMRDGWSMKNYIKMVDHDLDRLIILGGGFSRLPAGCVSDGTPLFGINQHFWNDINQPIYGRCLPVGCLSCDFNGEWCRRMQPGFPIFYPGRKAPYPREWIKCPITGFLKCNSGGGTYLGPEYYQGMSLKFPKKRWPSSGFIATAAWIMMSRVKRIFLAGMDGWMPRDHIISDTSGEDWTKVTLHDIKTEWDVLQHLIKLSGKEVIIGMETKAQS